MDNIDPLIIRYDYDREHLPYFNWPFDVSVIQEPPVAENQENGENVDDNHQLPEDVQIQRFEIFHYPDWPQGRRGDGEPPAIFTLHMDLTPVSLSIQRRYGQPGPFSTEIVTFIPLHQCNNYGDFFRRLRDSFFMAVRVELGNQPVENQIPGYRVTYVLKQPIEVRNDFDGIPWEALRTRLSIVFAEEN